jgi:hypothetical protein
MTDAESKDAWVRRVLGVDPSATSAGGGVSALPDALASWRQALETVDGQIAGLQRILHGSPDEDLHEIAEFGLNAMTGSYKTKLQAALMDASANPAKSAAAARLAASFAAHLGSDKRVAACDGNPFGVNLAIRATLVPALDSLQRALRASAA